MKLCLAILVYVIVGLVLGWGMLLAVQGSWWFLLAGFIAYVLIFARFGCLPKSHH